MILGEVHDNPAHHANQARITADLAPKALVFEMISPDMAEGLSAEDRSDAARLESALRWEARGWPDFDMYFPIFEAAPEARIIGGGAPREVVRDAFAKGAAEVFGSDAARFGLTTPLDPVELERRLQRQADAHCGALPNDMLPGMVEAQRLRDAVLAQAASDAFDAARLTSKDAVVVVITGNGHAREDWGLPAALRHARADLRIATFGQFEADPPEPSAFTSWVITEAVERPDPCDAFK